MKIQAIQKEFTMNIYDKNAEILAKKRMPAFCVCKNPPKLELNEFGNCSFCRLMKKRQKQKERKRLLSKKR